MCRKVVYLDREEAKRTAVHLAKLGHGKLTPYICPGCGKWNLGHTPSHSVQRSRKQARWRLHASK